MAKQQSKSILTVVAVIGLGITLVSSITGFQVKATETKTLAKNIGKNEEGLPLYDYKEYNRDQLMKCVVLTETKHDEAIEKSNSEESDKWLKARWQCFETYVELPSTSTQKDPIPIGEYDKNTDTFEFTYFD